MPPFVGEGPAPSRVVVNVAHNGVNMSLPVLPPAVVPEPPEPAMVVEPATLLSPPLGVPVEPPESVPPDGPIGPVPEPLDPVFVPPVDGSFELEQPTLPNQQTVSNASAETGMIRVMALIPSEKCSAIG
jgi:hypothetical protein